MSNEHQTSAERITLIEAVAVRVVCEAQEPAHPVGSSLNLTGAPHIMETERSPQVAVSAGQRSQSIGNDQSGSPMGKASAAWTGELKALDQHDAVSSLIRPDRGGLRIGVLTGMLVGALGLGWWTGFLDPYLKHGWLSTPLQQIALPDKAALEVDKLTPPPSPEHQVSAPAESSSKSINGEPAPHSDRGAPTPAATAAMTAQKATATKPAVAPPIREKKARNRPTPTPETKPTTIEGWTVRNVSGGTAVLQGPEGMTRATIGDTVPGAGRIDSIVRWGNRWIVATSKGLITTD